MATAKVSAAQKECKNVQEEVMAVMGQMETMNQATTKAPVCEMREESERHDIYTKGVFANCI